MNEVVDKYQEAVEYFDQNNFLKAEEIFVELLNENDNHFDALNYLGIIKLHNGKFREAAILFQKALEIDPFHSVTIYNLGLTFQNLGEYEKAETNYNTLLEIAPEHIDAINNLGIINLQRDKIIDAEKLFLHILELEPKHSDALINLGNIKFKQELYIEAISYYKKAIKTNSQNPIYIYNLGNAYLKIEDYDKAQDYFEKTLMLDPNHIGALNNLGIIYTKRNDPKKAEAVYENVLKLSPGNSDTMFNLAQCLEQNSKYDQAVDIYNSLLEQDPQNDVAILNLVGINDKLGNNAVSNELLNKINSTHYNKLAILTNLGISKMEQAKVDDAIINWKKALEIKPDSPEVNYNLAHANLLMGNFAEGWKGYEWRKKRKGFIERKLTGQELIDQDINDKTVFVYDEQGLGDSIQFVRYLKLLKQKKCKIIFECDPRLVYVFNNYKYIDVLIPRQNFDEPNIYYDYQISLLSLPQYFKTDIDTIPSEHSYLDANEELAIKLSSVISNANFLNVGIVWAGNSNHTNDKNRSCRLDNFEKIFTLNGVRFFSLQKGEALKQLRENTLPVVDLDSKGLDNFGHTAAIIENLDLIISVDTSVAHLAAAMGKPVWVILPFLPDWRWMLDRIDSPWYPTVKLFRQKMAGDWKGVFKEIFIELQKLIDSKFLSVNPQPNHDSKTNHDASDHHYSDHNKSSLNLLGDGINTKSTASNQIYLGLASGENFGWGVCSKYLRRELLKFIDIKNIDQDI